MPTFLERLEKMIADNLGDYPMEAADGFCEYKGAVPPSSPKHWEDKGYKLEAGLGSRVKFRHGDGSALSLDLNEFQDITPPPKVQPPHEPGFYRYDAKANWWIAASDEVAMDAFRGSLCVLDFESRETEPGVWLPTCCGLIVDNFWWFWWAKEGQRTMPFPRDATKVGHNSASYDRRYLSGEYQLPEPNAEFPNYPLDIFRGHFDTMQLALIVGGIAGDDDGGGKDGKFRTLWKKFQRESDSGVGVPRWFNETHSLGLKYLVKKFLGIDLSKEIRQDWVNDPTSVQPATLSEYCMDDVYYTALLFQKLWPIVRSQFIPSLVTWHGMRRTGDQRFFLKDWDKFLEQSEAEYQAAIAEIDATQNRVVGLACKSPDGLPALDWGQYVRGENTGKYKWTVKDITSQFSTNASVYICKLLFDGHRVELRKSGVGQPKWWANDLPLPHPDGESKNLGSPFCQDYQAMVETGRLTSDFLSKDELLRIFQIKESIAQWKSYRERYRTVYRQSTEWEGIEQSVAGLNDCGTISRRSLSDLWVVLPKPSEGKIGSSVMGHIVAPPGWKFVGADFVSQESRIAVAPLTDCRAGRHHSSPWSEAVLAGEKGLGTDVHSQTATALDISRDDAKTINFNIQYGGGLLGVATRISLIKGIPLDAATQEASAFLKRLKGRGGIAETTFSNLQFLAGTIDLRTYLLRVKQPNTINPKYLPSSREFIMVRGNHPIQSAGVDEKHTLISIIDILVQVRGLSGAAFFSNEIHDQIIYLAKDEVAEQVAGIFDTALSKLMELSYEQAALWWDAIDPLPSGPRPVLTPDPKWCKFEKVSIAQSLAGCK